MRWFTKWKFDRVVSKLLDERLRRLKARKAFPALFVSDELEHAMSAVLPEPSEVTKFLGFEVVVDARLKGYEFYFGKGSFEP